MADNSKIEWTDATWSPITGCSVVSPGCTNCYAMKLAGGRMQNHWSRQGLTKPSKAGPVWNGEVRFNKGWLHQPLAWKRPRTIFVCAHSDLFYDAVPVAWIEEIWVNMAIADRHRFQVLTKRPARMYEVLSDIGFRERVLDMHEAVMGARAPDWPLPNVWTGVSVEDRPRTGRINRLREVPAAVRFLSLEPLLEDLGEMDLAGIDWVIVGGESGPSARPMHPDWARSIRDQCQAAGVAFHFKQHGEFVSVSEVEGPGPHHTFPDGATVRRVGKKLAGRMLDGRTWEEMPA